MRSIRDVAVFAWAVTGINPNLVNYGQDRPRIGTQPADGLPTTYPRPGDLGNRAGETPKEPAFGHASFYPPSDAPTHAYRTRHASLDENMYDTAGSSRQAGWHASSAASAYPYGSSSDRYEEGYHQPHQHHRRPPLRPAFSYDALQDHARHQQQAYARPPAPASEAAARGGAGRCSFREELPPWGAEAAASSRRGIPSYGVGGGGSKGMGSGGGGGESSRKAGGRVERYFWE
jgi:hypothetical protein